MACRLLCAKPLSEPMVAYCQLDVQIKVSMKHEPKVNISLHYCDVIMGANASQITCLTIVYSTVYSGADQRKHQSSASLAYVRGIHRRPVNSPHKWPVTRKNVSIWWRHHEQKMYLGMWPANWRPFCLHLNVLKLHDVCIKLYAYCNQPRLILSA